MKSKITIGALLLFSAAVSSAPMRLPTEAEAQQIIYKFAEAYVCPGTQLTLMESANKGLPCPQGQNAVPMIYRSLMSGKWSEDQAMSLATGEFELFQPEGIDELVNVGNPDARVVVIEYTDPQCPFCSHFMRNQFADLKASYIDTGKVQYRYHHTPLSYHKDAFLASEASYCAADQDAYSAYHKVLLQDTNKQSREYLVEYARQTGLDTAQFTDCLDKHKYQAKVEDEKALLDKVEPITYPFFIVGHYQASEFKASSIYAAPWLYVVEPDKLTAIIDKELSTVN